MDKLCPRCDGFGRSTLKRKVKVPVRPGVTDGEIITIYGAGNGGYSKAGLQTSSVFSSTQAGLSLIRVHVHTSDTA